MNCKDMETQAVCLRLEDGTKVSAIAHFEYGLDAEAVVLNASTRYTDASGEIVYNPADFDEISVGVCATDTVCVESQEWTYGIDNTGTTPTTAAILCITNSDGSTVEIEQTQQASAGAWTPQMLEWGTNLQAAADSVGLLWFVETRFRNPGDTSDLSGITGIPGPPSIAVSEQLDGMLWRYLNIQICPGQPVPVSAVWKRLDDNGAIESEVNMTTAGAVLGPLQKFWMCPECGREPTWYLADGVTLAEAGQIPNCWEPCGTLTLAESPPDRACEFFFAEACDNVGEPDFDDNWVELVTRRATVCSGEQIAVDYYVPDAADPTSLVGYTLVGQFVDCDTGEPIPLPDPLLPDPAGVHHACVESRVEKKAGYSVSDFDSGDLEIGDAASCTFSLQVDDTNPNYVIAPVAGYTFVDNGNGDFTANFTWTGDSNPQQALQATAQLSTGEIAVISGEDFYLCSGGSESLLLEFVGETTLKEFCYEGFPSVYQDDDGNVVDIADYVKCIEPIPTPEQPCYDCIPLGKMYYLDVPDTPETLVEWWADPNGTQAGTAVSHDSVSNIFNNSGSTMNHVSGPADYSYVAPVFSVEGSNASDFLTGMGGLSTADTSGEDQAKLSAYFFLTQEGKLRDGGTRTGERGGLWLDECCTGNLELVEERTIDTTAAERGVFDGTVIPAGIHWGEALISDLSSWWNLTLEVSFDDGVTYEPLLGYLEKPTMDLIQVIKCKDTGELRNAITDEVLDPAMLFCENVCAASSTTTTASTQSLQIV